MTATLRQIALILAKDLRIEARSRQTLGLAIVLGILIVAVLGLGLATQGRLPAFGATSVLWVAFLFSGILCFEKTMTPERHDGALAALLGAPMDAGTIYLAKLAANLIALLIVAAVITPVGMLFFGFDLRIEGQGTWAGASFAAIMLLSLIGFAAVGTLFAALSSSSRLQGGLLAMMVLPVTLPLVIASTQMLIGLFRDGVPPGHGGLGILIAFCAIFLVSGWVVFEWVLEP